MNKTDNQQLSKSIKNATSVTFFLQIYAYRNSRVFGDEFVNKFGESLNLVKLSVKISVTILVLHQIW